VVTRKAAPAPPTSRSATGSRTKALAPAAARKPVGPEALAAALAASITFADANALREWFATHGDAAEELHLLFWKTGSGQPSVTWKESVDEALCVGWIDGVRRRVDDERYLIRFTPRRPGSTWSRVNIDRVQFLISRGRMTMAGLSAYALRTEENSVRYAYEQPPATLDPAHEKLFRSRKAAWKFFEAQPSGYRQVTIHWVEGAKRPETQLRRLQQLIDHSAEARRLPQFTRS